MTIFVSSCRNKLTKKYAKKNGTPCRASNNQIAIHVSQLMCFHIYTAKKTKMIRFEENSAFKHTLIESPASD